VHSEIPLDATGPQLRELLERLPSGETLHIRGPNGERVAVLITLTRPSGKPLSFPEWLARLDSLAQRVSDAWQGDTSAVETLAEMRQGAQHDI